MKLLAILFATTALISPIYANAIPIEFRATLSGPAESPPVASPGTGSALVIWDISTHTMEVKISFSGLTSGTTASHIHAPPLAPVNFPPLGPLTRFGVATQTPTFDAFPLGVTSGTYDHFFTTNVDSFFNPAYETAAGGNAALAEAALFNALLAGNAYLNIHTSNFPGGEIRGFLAAVPEPATLALLGLGLAGIGWSRRKS